MILNLNQRQCIILNVNQFEVCKYVSTGTCYETNARKTINSSKYYLLLYKIKRFVSLPGLRAVDFDGNTSDASSRVGNRSRVHIRDEKASTYDHFGLGKEAHTDVPQLSRSANDQRAENGGHGLRGNGAHV